MMHPIDKLLAARTATPKRVLVVGDAMIDRWVSGQVGACQDGYVRHIESQDIWTPGGAAGAARQFQRWDCSVWLLSPWHLPYGHGWSEVGYSEAFATFSTELCPNIMAGAMPLKTRYLDGERIAFRSDCETHQYAMSNGEITEARSLALSAVKAMSWDGILISDYDKGWLDWRMVTDIVSEARKKYVKVVVDAKREADFYPRLFQSEGCLKANLLWGRKNLVRPPAVITAAGSPPVVFGGGGASADGLLPDINRPVQCRNHVGAGDAFAAHLLLGLMHGLELREAATVASHAGRVYVQHLFGRPAWPHEVRKDALPQEGKVVGQQCLSSLKASLKGKRVVFTNGVFRLPTASHARMLAWTRGQGDVLVVGINDDVSAFRCKRGEFVLPLEERLALLTGMGCVDWIVPFSEDDPQKLCEVLGPDVLVKGSEYDGHPVPGWEYAGRVAFCPEDGRHASDVIREIRGA
jgi:D-beta-D-heptose 7-phosphate kinase / D-beta-D-heptose 1-phosphate adenosyltransferase